MTFLDTLETLLTDFWSSSFFPLNILAKVLSRASLGSYSFFLDSAYLLPSLSVFYEFLLFKFELTLFLAFWDWLDTYELPFLLLLDFSFLDYVVVAVLNSLSF